LFQIASAGHERRIRIVEGESERPPDAATLTRTQLDGESIMKPTVLNLIIIALLSACSGDAPDISSSQLPPVSDSNAPTPDAPDWYTVESTADLGRSEMLGEMATVTQYTIRVRGEAPTTLLLGVPESATSGTNVLPRMVVAQMSNGSRGSMYTFSADDDRKIFLMRGASGSVATQLGADGVLRVNGQPVPRSSDLNAHVRSAAQAALRVPVTREVPTAVLACAREGLNRLPEHRGGFFRAIGQFFKAIGKMILDSIAHFRITSVA
jgi:hypothetical protein